MQSVNEDESRVARWAIRLAQLPAESDRQEARTDRVETPTRRASGLVRKQGTATVIRLACCSVGHGCRPVDRRRPSAVVSEVGGRRTAGVDDVP